MKIMTFNCNGIRSAARKGFFEWMQKADVDVVCLQETRAQLEQLTDEIFHPSGYTNYFFDAEKRGYSGTALYCKKKPEKVITGLNWAIAETEGRYIQADYNGLSIASLYMPSGSSGPDKQARKMEFMGYFLEHMRSLRRKRQDYIICGDWNICHKEIDLKNWRPNQKNSGFLPEERAWLDRVYDELGYVDAFRIINQEAEQYSWWSNRGQARAKNVGWRLDYHVVTPAIAKRVKSTYIYTDENFSDHAPVVLEYGGDL